MYCHNCNKPIKGRTDKKFCDAHCRSTYHNDQKSRTDAICKQINKILLRNRNILKSCINIESSISRTALIQEGFSFEYYTHVSSNGRNNNPIIYCYDIGYTISDMLKVKIVENGLLNNPQNRRTNHFVN